MGGTVVLSGIHPVLFFFMSSHEDIFFSLLLEIKEGREEGREKCQCEREVFIGCLSYTPRPWVTCAHIQNRD